MKKQKNIFLLIFSIFFHSCSLNKLFFYFSFLFLSKLLFFPKISIFSCFNCAYLGLRRAQQREDMQAVEAETSLLPSLFLSITLRFFCFFFLIKSIMLIILSPVPANFTLLPGNLTLQYCFCVEERFWRKKTRIFAKFNFLLFAQQEKTGNK